MNKCYYCSQEIKLGLDLLKLKDGKWYCIICICSFPFIFNLLKKNGFWFYQLRKLITFKEVLL